MQAEPGPVDAACQDKTPDLASAAIINSSSSPSLALQQVQHIMKEHKELMQLDAENARASNDEGKLKLVELELQCLERARKALERITCDTLRQELSRDVKNRSERAAVVKTVIRCGSEYLKSYAQDFWSKAFVEACDTGERCVQG